MNEHALHSSSESKIRSQASATVARQAVACTCFPPQLVVIALAVVMYAQRLYVSADSTPPVGSSVVCCAGFPAFYMVLIVVGTFFFSLIVTPSCFCFVLLHVFHRVIILMFQWVLFFFRVFLAAFFSYFLITTLTYKR